MSDSPAELIADLANFLREVSDEAEYASEETIAKHLVETGWVIQTPDGREL